MKHFVKLIKKFVSFLTELKDEICYFVTTPTKPGYLVNTKTNEIHDLKNPHINCHIERMTEKNKRYINEGVKNKMLLSKEANGCRWCMPDEDKG